MTDSQVVLATLKEFGALSDYGIYHAARAKQHRMTPSSARSRRAELARSGKVKAVGEELSPTGRKAQVWAVA